MVQPVAAYGSDVRPVSFGAPMALPPWTGQVGLGRVEITQAEPAIAQEIVSILTAQGVDAVALATPSGTAQTVILTEGLSAADPATRHWTALAHARVARAAGARLVLLQSASPQSHAAVSGLPGLSRTLQKEWPDTNVATWSLAAPDALTRAHHILTALGTTLGDAILTADGHARQTQVAASLAPPTTRAATAPALWLVTGGARGVTATCAIELARRTGGTFLLAGRSALSPWPQGIARTADLKTLRAALAQNAVASGQKVKPADIDRAARAALG